jgi:hypothetical protein
MINGRSIHFLIPLKLCLVRQKQPWNIARAFEDEAIPHGIKLYPSLFHHVFSLGFFDSTFWGRHNKADLHPK